MRRAAAALTAKCKAWPGRAWCPALWDLQSAKGPEAQDRVSACRFCRLMGILAQPKEQLLLRRMLPSGGGRRGSGRRGRLTGQRAPRAVHGGRGRRGRLTGARRAGGDNEVQRTMLEIVNQLDGFDSRGNIKARAPRRPPGPPRPRPCSPVGARRLRVARGRAGQPPARPGAVPEPACLPGGRACVAAE